MNKKAKIILIVLAIIIIIATFVVNIVYDSVVIIPKTQLITDVYGNKKEFTTMKYSPEYKYPKALSEFFYTLSIAILVYFLIEHTLSTYENERRQKELDSMRNNIHKDVFEAVLKKIIPETLFDIVTNDILYKSFIRKNVKWEYEISENAITGGYDLTQLIIYELCNISNIKMSVPLTLTIYQNNKHKAAFQNFDVQNMDGAKINVTPQDNGYERILNLEFEPGQTLKIIHHIKIEYSNYHVTDCHFTNYSIIGLEIRVRKPSDCSFRPLPTFSSNLEVLKEDANTIIYKPVKGLLKGQALVYLLDKIGQVSAPVSSMDAKQEALREELGNAIIDEVLTKS